VCVVKKNLFFITGAIHFIYKREKWRVTNMSYRLYYFIFRKQKQCVKKAFIHDNAALLLNLLRNIISAAK
jgi:hypothetical protein